MSFLNRSFIALSVLSAIAVSANAQTTWPRATAPSYPVVQQPCLPGTVPSVVPTYPSTVPTYPSTVPTYPSTTPSVPSAMPSTPGTLPMSPLPGTTAPTSPTTPSPIEQIIPSPLSGRVQPDQLGVGNQTAFADRGGGSALTGLTPMIGDLGLGGFAPSLAAQQSSSGLSRARGAAAIVSRNSFKIQENESPRPLDRIFGNYNYFNDLRNGTVSRLDLHRETVGFEKTFLDQRASIGFRLPFLQTSGAGSQGAESGVGDLSIVGKYVLAENRDTGNIFTLGTVVTVPTGRTFSTLGLGGDFRTTYIQPWLGGVMNFDDFYLQGFSSLAVPTDSNQTTFLFNSLGLNYRLYQAPSADSTLRFIVPTLEAHLTTPLNNRGLLNGNGFGFPDIFVLTGGTHFGLGRATITTAVGLPLTGPRPFGFEGILQMNLFF